MTKMRTYRHGKGPTWKPMTTKEKLNEAKAKGREEVIEAIRPWLLGLDSVPWEDEINKNLDELKFPND